jgi:hypothetical protein
MKMKKLLFFFVLNFSLLFSLTGQVYIDVNGGRIWIMQNTTKTDVTDSDLFLKYKFKGSGGVEYSDGNTKICPNKDDGVCAEMSLWDAFKYWWNYGIKRPDGNGGGLFESDTLLMDLTLGKCVINNSTKTITIKKGTKLNIYSNGFFVSLNDAIIN